MGFCIGIIMGVLGTLNPVEEAGLVYNTVNGVPYSITLESEDILYGELPISAECWADHINVLEWD